MRRCRASSDRRLAGAATGLAEERLAEERLAEEGLAEEGLAEERQPRGLE